MLLQQRQVLDQHLISRSVADLPFSDFSVACCKSAPSFLEQHGIRFAAAKVKKNSYEKKVTAALYFLGSAGGYREAGGAMGMARSYVMEITTEVVRVLTGAASAVISIPRSRQRWRAVEDEFASRHGYPGVAGAIDGSLLAIECPDKFDGFYCRKCYPALNVQAVLLRTTSS
ncbi:hypothetical protein PF004_g24496 [Phytophthora fragariae]|uniref:DDE Tnp4 domain-containing protein n=1 Tax=Phytophthora fragariae TaxID=53985 RepID=A0A6G0MVX3_9STRA|nr:hypothetical protein PF004_g24496 [Phytophthora fragariae]